ncbi:hypothetical protein [Streptomyces sp. NPDC095613]|uniref:hypothetical protein n=1 Tax=Streptomyces sp. NPDC095613 TaxID=3155540 RepID=UPI003316C0B6
MDSLLGRPCDRHANRGAPGVLAGIGDEFRDDEAGELVERVKVPGSQGVPHQQSGD